MVLAANKSTHEKVFILKLKLFFGITIRLLLNSFAKSLQIGVITLLSMYCHQKRGVL
jgi:hypothetical protein